MNPHADFTARGSGTRHWSPLDQGRKKWGPSDSASPHWYDQERLERLIAAYLAKGDGVMPIREFISKFRGLARTECLRDILAETGLQRLPLSRMARNGDLDHELTRRLLSAMKMRSAPVKPDLLGVIGKDNLEAQFESADANMDTFSYRKLTGTTADIPWVLEVAFASAPDSDERRLVTGVNWSPAIINPFRNVGGAYGGMDGILGGRYVNSLTPAIMFVHLATARAEYTDRGKSALVVDASLPLEDAINYVTSRWYKQARAEIRDLQARLNRADALKIKPDKPMSQKAAAYEVMEAAYLKASANGTLPANARQIMYAARPEILRLSKTDRLNSSYFTQTLLVDYIEEQSEQTADWRVDYDARGHFTEPHTGHSVPVGTAEVRAYLRSVREPIWFDPSSTMPDIDTRGPSGCYGAVLFIEKEGFNALFEAVRLAERYDIAIMSTKGTSVVAARRLADKLCFEHKIPLFVLHDYDISGVNIHKTLVEDGRRYTYENKIESVDFGLRLEDVGDLEREMVLVEGKKLTQLDHMLEDGEIDDDDYEFLKDSRVELNAFTSDELVAFIERKLAEQGVKKVIPDDATLAEAYRRRRQSEWLEAANPSVDRGVARRREGFSRSRPTCASR